MSKASGGDGIAVELFQILKDDAVKVLHSALFIIARTWKQPRCPSAEESCGTYTQWSITQSLKRIHLNKF